MLCGCNGGILEDRQKAVVNPHDESTVEGLLLMLWAERDEKGSMAAIAEKLIAIAPDQLDEVELYLPQFAHIVANLSDMFSAADINELERFLLSVTQLSIHIVRAMITSRTSHANWSGGSRLSMAGLPGVS